MGKSQMLTATSSLAPRGVYVCGNTTSSSGLTVTVVKDANTGDFALEAGALVMGDQVRRRLQPNGENTGAATPPPVAHAFLGMLEVWRWCLP